MTYFKQERSWLPKDATVADSPRTLTDTWSGRKSEPLNFAPAPSNFQAALSTDSTTPTTAPK